MTATTQTSALDRAAWGMYIGGQWVESSSSAVLESFDPTTGTPWTQIQDASDDDVDRAVEAASGAMDDPEWRDMSATARGELVAELGRRVSTHAEELAYLETRENGKLLHENRAMLNNVPRYFNYYAGLADKVEGRTFHVDKPNMFAYTIREPIGVVAAIVPWNSPSYLTAVKLAPALVCGNAVIVKPSEHAATPILRLAEVAADVGFPPGVINVLTGSGTGAGARLCGHPGVGRVAFTGGTTTARQVIAATAENFAQISLELGGKSPNIIFDDADVSDAVTGIIAGTFAANGQSCVAGSRVLVHEAVYDAVATELKERTGQLRIGDPMDATTQIGPLALRSQLEWVRSHVAAAREEGADVFSSPHDVKSAGGGWFFPPTVVEGPPNLSVTREEMFAPVVSLLRFRTEEEAIAIANETAYGLAAGVWTANLKRAHRVVGRLRCGIAWVNTYRSASPIVPFGGRGSSGYGLEAGQAGLESYLVQKSVWLNTSEEPMPDPFIMR